MRSLCPIARCNGTHKRLVADAQKLDYVYRRNTHASRSDDARIPGATPYAHHTLLIHAHSISHDISFILQRIRVEARAATKSTSSMRSKATTRDSFLSASFGTKDASITEELASICSTGNQHCISFACSHDKSALHSRFQPFAHHLSY